MLERQSDTLRNLAALDAAELQRATSSELNWKVCATCHGTQLCCRSQVHRHLIYKTGLQSSITRTKRRHFSQEHQTRLKPMTSAESDIALCCHGQHGLKWSVIL